MDNYTIREIYDRIMYILPEYIPIPIKNLIDNWVGENYLRIFLERGVKIKIVVDANIIISEVIAYFKKGKSHFLDLLNHAIIEAFAPSYIIEELGEHIEEITKKTKKTEEETWTTIKLQFLSKIKLKEVKNKGMGGYSELIDILKERDPDDIPYMILYLSEDADTILSKDHHFIGLSGIFTMQKVGHLKKVLYDIERGNLALLVTIDVLPKLVIYLARIIITILILVVKALSDFAVKAIETLKNGTKKFIEWFSGLTPEGKVVGVILSLISAGIAYAYRDWIQKNIIEPLKDVISEIITRIIQFFKQLGSLLKDLIYAATEIVRLMLESIQKCIEIYESLKSRIDDIEVI